MNTQQAPNASRTVKIVAGLAVLSLALAWVATTFDTDISRSLDTAKSAPVAETERRGITADAAQAQQQDGNEQSTETARQTAGLTAESQAAVQATQRRAEDEDRDVSPKVGRALTNVIELLNADKYTEATAALEPLLTWEALSGMTPFERSRVYQLSFNLNMQKENYEAAQADIQAAVESGGLNAREFSQMTYQSAQLFMQMEDYAKAADSLELWVAQQGTTLEQGAAPNPGAYYLLAASYYYQNKFDDARDHMETLFTIPGEKQEGWYAMMASLYLQNEDYTKAKPVVEKMVELYGDDRYREQLAGINAQLQRAER